MRIAIEEIKTTFFRTPNIRIFLLYGNLTKYIIQSFHLARNLYGQNPIPEAIYSNTIKDALGEVCKVIHQFMDQPKEEFSANIMVFIDNRKVEGSRIINELKKNKELFIIGNHLDSSCFNGVLLSLNELNYNMDNIQPNLFAIPLLNNKLIKEKQIPGAASAFFDGEFIMDDTLKIEDNHVEISNDIKSQAEVFYKKNKDRFRSFGSFSISLIDSDHSNKNKHIMIGVLTLYYKNINILGEGTSFHSTFNALLQPILHSLASELDNYLNMYRDDLIKKNYFNHETNAPK
ncbi:hypothetical protein [Aquiflexum sp.]|uniref:hypothetical protein n=1 Tax=Aquiflexum sp. TaxID=1872584 RepID=UPI003593357F